MTKSSKTTNPKFISLEPVLNSSIIFYLLKITQKTFYKSNDFSFGFKSFSTIKSILCLTSNNIQNFGTRKYKSLASKVFNCLLFLNQRIKPRLFNALTKNILKLILTLFYTPSMIESIKTLYYNIQWHLLLARQTNLQKNIVIITP